MISRISANYSRHLSTIQCKTGVLKRLLHCNIRNKEERYIKNEYYFAKIVSYQIISSPSSIRQQLTHAPSKKSQIALIFTRRAVRTFESILGKGSMNSLSFDTSFILLELGKRILRRKCYLFARAAGHWVARTCVLYQKMGASYFLAHCMVFRIEAR